MDHTTSHDMSMNMGHDSHSGDMNQHTGHSAALELVKHADATHVAINNGSWFDSATWENGIIPGDDARVLIKNGIKVDYDAVSEARLFTVRVDGELNFSHDVSSKMVVDTMVVDTQGTLIAGTKDQPIQSDVNVEIVIANNGPIDVSWDPTLLSRGIITQGQTIMHGQEKTVDLKVAIDPMAGDTTITLAENPSNWNVGDTIVLAGSRYDGYRWDNQVRAVTHNEPEDEILKIAKIEGNIVHFETPLVHDHDTPRGDLKVSVANYTRNISIESEDGAASNTYERGHLMFMHNDDVDVRYVELNELGRTDKSIAARNPSEFGDGLDSTSNVKGRYALHLHQSGVDDVENPVVLEGNAVFGSPGWGVVHHDSNAVIHDNATYNTFGAGFVAETGNEIGIWSDNIAIYAKGNSWESPKNGNDPGNFDNGKTGSGYYFEGRMVEVIDNVAASVNSGFTYFHRGRKEDVEDGLDGVKTFNSDLFDLPEALGNTPAAKVDDAPILHFNGNETFAANKGFFVQKGNPNQGHDVRTILTDFTAWEVVTGTHIGYTSHYLLKNFDVVGKTSTKFSSAKSGSGIDVGINASDVTIVDAKIDGFKNGISVSDVLTVGGRDPALKQIFAVNPTIKNVKTEYNDYNPVAFKVVDSADIVEGRFEINLDKELTYHEGYPDPTARKVVISGTKTDSLGTIPLPAGTDEYNAGYSEVMRILKSDGYFSAANGKYYFILEDYYSDRLTGEIFKVGELVEIDHDLVVNTFHKSWSRYSDVVYSGEIDLDTMAPVAKDDNAVTQMEQDVVINLLKNDSDPDGDQISIDGIVQPLHGRVFDNGDGTITYRPDIGYTGTDGLKYWVTDGFGNFTEAHVTIKVDKEMDHDNHNPPKPDEPDTPHNPPKPDIDAPHHLIDGTLTQEVLSYASENKGVTVGAINRWSAIGKELGLNGSTDTESYLITKRGATATTEDGQVINANYFTLSENKLSKDAQTLLSDSALKTALSLSDVALNVETIEGTSFKDTFSGRGKDDHFIGGAGNDYFESRGGNDIIEGGTGNDKIFTHHGNDIIDGGAGNDIIDGGTGNDRLILSGSASDYFVLSHQGNDLLIYGREGTDKITNVEEFTFENGETLTLNEFVKQSANLKSDVAPLLDFIDLTDAIKLYSDAADHVITNVSHEIKNGDKGDDYLSYALSSEGLQIRTVGTYTEIGEELGLHKTDRMKSYVISETDAQAKNHDGNDLHDNALENALQLSDIAVNFEMIEGSRYADKFSGNFDSDYFIGGAGDDYINSGGGDDIIYGGKGADVIIGGEGADTIAYKVSDLDGNFDTIQDFSISEGDVLQFDDLLKGNDIARVDIHKFLRIEDLGNNTSKLSVDTSGSGEKFQNAAKIKNDSDILNLDDMIAKGVIIF